MPDPTSQSNYLDISSKHISLTWKIDFTTKTISGTAEHDLVIHKDVDQVKHVRYRRSRYRQCRGLRTWRDLATSGSEFVFLHAREPSKRPEAMFLQWTLGAKHEVMGSALSVKLPQSLNLTVGSTVNVKVSYSTTEYSKALQWLDKEQTQGGTHPYLFSQCQPIYARALVPIQDTPSVKITYRAAITSVLPVLMSAIRLSPSSIGSPEVVGIKEITYEYHQPVPIPSYLLAIASGNIVYRPFSVPEGKTWTSGVWAEQELIEAAWQEFNEDTPKFLEAEEKITAPYKFGVYDLLVLPPAFPYGGMENACLTFVTPTLLTGDRTLVDVVVHEITHSWFGNGITHADASHFWLNEGWTTYIERLLQQILHSPQHRGLSYLIGSKMLYDDLELYKNNPKYQRLQIDFEYGEDPDDAYSSVPYEKGANFILHLERALGGLDVFLPYVKHYVNKFMGQSITTQQWKDDLFQYFSNDVEARSTLEHGIRWDDWLFGEGITLPVPIEYDMTLAHQAYALAQRWDKSRTTDVSELTFKKTDLDGMDANQISVFLERLQSFKALPKTHIDHLATLYSFSDTPNAEIRLRFYQVALLDPASPAAQSYAVEAAKWVVGEDGSGVVKGRMKFCRPVFRDVHAALPDLAKATYLRNKMSFHPIARSLIEKDLGISGLV
ncbi:hypothetical protein F5I97DRAFT_1930308 [Phlebopus sp. FC_14]|nr:hypothetical protein F5I97DRAFT_1930308 [Phlebopus sp. FC_14]